MPAKNPDCKRETETYEGPWWEYVGPAPFRQARRPDSHSDGKLCSPELPLARRQSRRTALGLAEQHGTSKIAPYSVVDQEGSDSGVALWSRSRHGERCSEGCSPDTPALAGRWISLENWFALSHLRGRYPVIGSFCSTPR